MFLPCCPEILFGIGRIPAKPMIEWVRAFAFSEKKCLTQWHSQKDTPSKKCKVIYIPILQGGFFLPPPLPKKSISDGLHLCTSIVTLIKTSQELQKLPNTRVLKSQVYPSVPSILTVLDSTRLNYVARKVACGMIDHYQDKNTPIPRPHMAAVVT